MATAPARSKTLLRYRSAAMAEFWRALKTLKALQAEQEQAAAPISRWSYPHPLPRRRRARAPPDQQRPRHRRAREPNEPERPAAPDPGLPPARYSRFAALATARATSAAERTRSAAPYPDRAICGPRARPHPARGRLSHETTGKWRRNDGYGKSTAAQLRPNTSSLMPSRIGWPVQEDRSLQGRPPC